MIGRMPHPLRFVLAAALVIAVLLAGSLGAAAHGPDPLVGGGLFAQDQTVKFRWRAGSEPPTAIKTAIKDAAADSNATRASRAAIFTYDSGGSSLIGYGTGTCGVNGIGCFTRSAPTSFTMWLREHGRSYEWGTLRWCQIQNVTGCYDAETIALDEFGHVEVLGHHVNFADDRDYTDAVVQTYSRTRPQVGYDMHEYGVCDIATLQVQYDIPGASSPYSTCLDIATTMSLSFPSTSVAYRTRVTATAVLRVATTSAYGKLSANPVSQRAVVLQARTVGSSSWYVVGTMAPSSPTGSYVASTNLVATTDFRAIFTAPSNEGLRSVTSATVRVTVTPCSINCPEPSLAR